MNKYLLIGLLISFFSLQINAIEDCGLGSSQSDDCAPKAAPKPKPVAPKPQPIKKKPIKKKVQPQTEEVEEEEEEEETTAPIKVEGATPVVPTKSVETKYTLSDTQQKEMVTAHNTWRAKVGVPPVAWSSKIADVAQSWADTLKGQGCKMTHRTGNGYGENLYWASPLKYSDGRVAAQTVPPTKAVNSWGNEVKNYDYDSNSCATGKVCGNYTQVVWKTSTKIGCGMAVCGDFSQVWVCNYNPPGNYIGQKPY